MKGYIRSISTGKAFGFIRSSNSADYFFHKDDFVGHWTDLIADYELFKNGERIEVTFDVAESTKGPRAGNVRRLDFPNQAV